MCKYLFLVLVLFSSGTLYGLSVDYTPNDLSCGTNTIEGTFVNCSFTGSVLINGTVVTVTNGSMTFTVSVASGTASPFSISGVVVSSDDGSCAPGSEPFSNTVTHTCSPPPANNECSGAELLVISDLTCNFESFSTSGQDGTGTLPSCGIAGYYDLWYEFEANYSEVSVEFGSFPGTLLYFAVYDDCGGNEISCHMLFGGVKIGLVEGLTEGEIYKIQVLTLPGSSGGMQEICMYNDFVLAIEDIRLSLSNHTSYNVLTFNSSKEVTQIQIERKVNESLDFEIIGEMDVEGDGKYTFEDNELESLGIYTYRLKMYDIDGIASYSNLVSTRNDDHKDLDFNLAPNPCGDYINFNLGSYWTEANCSMKIFNAQFENVMEIQDFESRTLDVSNLNKGIYFVRIETKGDSRVLKFMKT